MTAVESESPARPRAELFAISFVVLFFELACIRWFGRTVDLPDVLHQHRADRLRAGDVGRLPRGGAAVGPDPRRLPAHARGGGPGSVDARGLPDATGCCVDVGNQASPQQIYFGAETPAIGSFGGGVPIEVFAGVFFALIALIVRRARAGAGTRVQRPARTGSRRTRPTSPGACRDRRLRRSSRMRGRPRRSGSPSGSLPRSGSPGDGPALHASLLVAILAVVGQTPTGEAGDEVVWSPYYKVVFRPGSNTIFTNNIGHQQMVSVGADRRGATNCRYLLNRDAGGPPLEDVLIIGAGSGNDVQAALKHGARHVDAVEIDPVLNEIGRARPPRPPLRRPPGLGPPRRRPGVRPQDRAASTTWSSTPWSTRWCCTRAIRASAWRASCSPSRRSATSRRPAQARTACSSCTTTIARAGSSAGSRDGREGLRHQADRDLAAVHSRRSRADKAQSGMITFLIVGKTEAAVAPIRARFARSDRSGSTSRPTTTRPSTATAPSRRRCGGARDGDWQKIAPAAVETAGIGRMPTDDWPFLYLRAPTIPWFNLRGMLVMAAALAGDPARVFAPGRRRRPNGRMFFLGAGFMLLETKGVVHLALLFGSTWVVNSVVFFAILVMILLSNLYVLAAQPRRTRPITRCCSPRWLVNLAVPMAGFLALPGSARVVASCPVVFVPVFFAGVIFATRRSARAARPDLDFGSNIGGVILGGLSEYLSLVVGFNGLLLVACVYYLLSALLAPRREGGPGGETEWVSERRVGRIRSAGVDLKGRVNFFRKSMKEVSTSHCVPLGGWVSSSTSLPYNSFVPSTQRPGGRGVPIASQGRLRECRRVSVRRAFSPPGRLRGPDHPDQDRPRRGEAP